MSLMPLVVASMDMSKVPKKPFMKSLIVLSAASTFFSVALTCCTAVLACCWVFACSSLICFSC